MLGTSPLAVRDHRSIKCASCLYACRIWLPASITSVEILLNLFQVTESQLRIRSTTQKKANTDHRLKGRKEVTSHCSKFERWGFVWPRQPHDSRTIIRPFGIRFIYLPIPLRAKASSNGHSVPIEAARMIFQSGHVSSFENSWLLILGTRYVPLFLFYLTCINKFLVLRRQYLLPSCGFKLFTWLRPHVLFYSPRFQRLPFKLDRRLSSISHSFRMTHITKWPCPVEVCGKTCEQPNS